MVILGQLSAFDHRGQTVCGVQQRARGAFYFEGISVQGYISIYTWHREKHFKKHLTTMGLSPRSHGNLGKIPHHAVTLDDARHAVTLNLLRHMLFYFLEESQDTSGLTCRYGKNINSTCISYEISLSSQLLPSSTTKLNVWLVYKEACERSNKRVLAYTTFCRLWRNQVPCILVMKPMSDLCWFCQRNTNFFLRSANQPEESKSAAVKEAEEYLRVVGIERSFYKTMCDTSKQSLTHYLTSNSLAALPTEPAEPCSRPHPTASTWLSRFTIRVTLSSLVPCTFLHQESVEYSVYAMRPSPVRLTFLLRRHVTPARGPTTSFQLLCGAWVWGAGCVPARRQLYQAELRTMP